MTAPVYDVWMKYYLRENRYGINEDYFLIEDYVKNDKFWESVKGILSQKEHNLFVDPEETANVIVKKAREYIEPKCYLTYYTSFDTACSLIKNEELWLTSSDKMNDYGEIDFGVRNFWEKFKSDQDSYNGLLECCNIFENNKVDIVSNVYANQLDKVLSNVYFTCFSELSEYDTNGKLSMWRNYAEHGVCFVFNKNKILGLTTYYMENFEQKRGNICSCLPVTYARDYGDSLVRVLKNTINEVLFYKDEYKTMYCLTSKLFLDELFSVIAISVILMKHPMFYEEEEDRFFVALGSDDNKSANNSIELCKEKVKGEQRNVIKLKFGGLFKDALFYDKKFSWNELVKEILIWADSKNNGEKRKENLNNLFRSKGMDFSDKIRVVDIPLRV